MTIFFPIKHTAFMELHPTQPFYFSEEVRLIVEAIIRSYPHNRDFDNLCQQNLNMMGQTSWL